MAFRENLCCTNGFITFTIRNMYYIVLVNEHCFINRMCLAFAAVLSNVVHACVWGVRVSVL